MEEKKRSEGGERERGKIRRRGKGGNEGGRHGRGSRRLTRQISSEYVHFVGFRWLKTTILSKFLTFWGVSIGLFYRPLAAKTPNFCHFWTSAFSDVDSWRQSEKVEHKCTTTNLPLSNGIKINSVLQRLHGEIGRTNSDVQKRD